MTVNRMGFGAMRITGQGIWGEPKDVETYKRVRRAVELGINLIDAAASYGGQPAPPPRGAHRPVPVPHGGPEGAPKGLRRHPGAPARAGEVRHVGLSNVTVEQLRQARKIVPIVSVQNRYNLADRHSEDVLTECEKEGIGFLPWYPLAASELAKDACPLAKAAKRHGVTPGQFALAWLLHCSPVMLPIPGTSSLAHLEENTAAAAVKLSPNEVRALRR